MPLKTLGKPPYLLPKDVANDDLVEIVEKPYMLEAEETKWKKPKGVVTVQLPNKNIRRWFTNVTTWDALVRAYGEDEAIWVGKKIKVRKETRTISGEEKEVLFGKPYMEPQQQIGAPI